ncbi:ADP-ribose glycohydrolase OARD1 isoform X2 [Paramormyrops kingsleyae]|uniref:ADP-ribose glycohydrolase OARD1 isoform X2 n=1 Tax=Paramormyrops kingsleyae TaxID=1676925 RepID=UPI000CD621AD|nr:O-acetyl-ADP-ribose deacetylase 1 isoform X2 [Paramormyrops kingsleyae]XP_023669173.1 O-acetyl-ADP-ribose deacetylase 1 isoform X2 [Paramormyrops kingsleyae]
MCTIRRHGWSPAYPTATSRQGSLCFRETEPRTPARKGEEDPWVRGLRYLKGNLFSCPPQEALAHCISEDCRMGAGIAVLFKKQFGGVSDLKAQNKKTGDCAVLRRHNRFVYYLITKKKASQKPTYESLKQSLVAMKTHCWENSVASISIPRIGCGLDRLSWEKVSVIIEEVFRDSNIRITVYSL